MQFDQRNLSVVFPKGAVQYVIRGVLNLWSVLSVQAAELLI